MNQSRSKSKGVFQPQTLDVDESIFDKNLKIVDDQGIDDQMTGIFPGLGKNANISTSKFKAERKLLPQEDYPAVQVELLSLNVVREKGDGRAA